MEKLENEQTNLNSQPAVAEEKNGEQGGEVSLGKFKDVNALLSAYSSLQSEFTKRCQRIKELEGALKPDDKDKVPAENLTAVQNAKQELTEQEKQEVLKEYLQGVLDKKQKDHIPDSRRISRTAVHRELAPLRRSFCIRADGGEGACANKNTLTRSVSRA